MKKKVLAFLLASTMVIEPFSVASAADFSDGMGQDTVQFSDDAEDVPEVENDDVDQFSTNAVGEGEESTEQGEQIGDSVYVKFEKDTATISGTGDMWDFYENGYDYTNKHQNPFIGKSGIKKIVVEDGVTSVGSLLLKQYDETDSVEEILLGKDIKKIGKSALFNCYNVKSIILPTELEKIDDNVFEGWSALENIEIPNSVNVLGERCFDNCRNLKRILLPHNLEYIPNSMFNGCSNLTQIDLPFNIQSIGDSAFYGCSNLKNIELPLGLKEIGNYAFGSCKSFAEITLPKTLKSLGYNVFSGCTNLTNMIFEEGFSCDISSQMFGYCTALQEISIPKSIANIGYEAFFRCSRLTTIIIEGNTTGISSTTFNDCPNLRTIKGYDCSYAKKYYDSLTSSQKQQIKFESLGESSHQFTAEKVQIKEPTCTEKGSKAYRCEICGEIQNEEEIPAYGHKWDNGVITKEATEKEDGVRTYTCRRCNETKTEIIPKLSAINLQISQEEQYWNGHYQYSFYCISDKDITYYVECVKKDSGQPVYDDTKQDGKIKENGGRWINVDITDEDAVDIYIFATNTNGDYVYKKVTPDYTQRPQKPTVDGNFRWQYKDFVACL